MRGRLAQFIIASGLVLSGLPTSALAAVCNDVSGGAAGGANCAKVPGSPSDLGPSVTSIINLLLVIVGIASVVMLIIGGFRYIFSQGNEKNIGAAKDTILYSVVGLIVALLSYAIVNFVLKRF